MKRILLLCIFFNLIGTCIAQNLTDQDKKDLEKLSKEFKQTEEKLGIENQKLNILKNEISTLSDSNISEKIALQLKENKKYKLQLDSIYELYESYKNIYLSKGITNEKLKELFPHEYKITNNESTNEPETKTYFYFGENNIIEEKDQIFKNKTANNILEDVLKTKSESYLGDFIIPKKGQAIPYFYFTRECGLFKKKVLHTASSYLKFKSIKIHLFEGSLYDIKLIVTDQNNKEYLFENQHPVSLLRYSVNNYNRYLYCNPIEIEKPIKELNDDTKLLYYRLRLSDVLQYIANPGNNYVPEDEVLEFPIVVDNVETNRDQAVNYKMIANTELENIVELRTYTDFLGLFNETPNGILQLEGRGDFYVAPFNFTNSTWYIFKKISPFVNFSRIDEDMRNLTLEETDSNTYTIKNPLEILEKSYLQMGLNMNLISFKFAKEYPFDVNIYGTTRYQISDIMNIDSQVENYKSFGLGGGICLEFKRYNNFGFIYSAEMVNYNSKNFNEIEKIDNPDSFWAFQNKAEVYYFPGKTKKQSIFLRFKTFNNSTKGNDEAFYQLQFGYRFSIGVGKITD